MSSTSTYQLALEVITPILSILVVSGVTLFVWIIKKLNSHDVALAVILQQLNPPNEKSLRTLLSEIQIDQVRQAERQTITSYPPNPPIIPGT